jgi:hypothetical protein
VSLRRYTFVASAVVIGLVGVAAASGKVGRILDSRPAAVSAAPTVTATPPVVPATTAAPDTTTAPVEPSVFDTDVTTPHDDDQGLWLSWSLADTAGDRRVGSANSSTERTNAESSMKAWIATDFVRIAGDRGRTVRASDRADIDAAIRRSDDAAAERLYRRLGADQVLRDLKSVCGVGIATARRGYWSYAQITATDATAILACVLDKAPTYPGGDEIVDDLRNVVPDDAFGIPQALPSGTTFAVKNGWTAHSGTGKWNVDCVASWDHYTLAVLLRYPIARKLDYGAGVCRDVTATLLTRLG